VSQGSAFIAVLVRHLASLRVEDVNSMEYAVAAATFHAGRDLRGCISDPHALVDPHIRHYSIMNLRGSHIPARRIGSQHSRYRTRSTDVSDETTIDRVLAKRKPHRERRTVEEKPTFKICPTVHLNCEERRRRSHRQRDVIGWADTRR
jgi:hypothetical protein